MSIENIKNMRVCFFKDYKPKISTCQRWPILRTNTKCTYQGHCARVIVFFRFFIYFQIISVIGEYLNIKLEPVVKSIDQIFSKVIFNK